MKFFVLKRKVDYMKDCLKLDDFTLSYTLLKVRKKIYLVTTPHGIFICKNREYPFIKNDKEFKCKLYKQAYWCDLAFFEIINKNKIKLSELKILKSNPSIYNLSVENRDIKIKGFIEKFCYLCHLDINGGNRNFYYQMSVLKGVVDKGSSGTGIYCKDRLIGIISNCIEKKAFLVPSFFILKVLDEKLSDYSPYIPFQLNMIGNDVILQNSYLGLKKGFIFKKFNGLSVNKGMIYCSEIKDNIPMDVYLQIFCSANDIITISDGKFIHKIKIKNLNDYLKVPFISGISREDRNKINKLTFQDIWCDLSVENIRLINHNLSLCEIGSAV